MKTNRFVVIDTVKKYLSVYEGKKQLAVFEFDDKYPVEKELIEEIRTAEYKDLA
jgi:hypothetical protein